MVKSMYDRDIDMLRLAYLAFTGKCAYSLDEAVHLYCRYDNVAIRGDEIECRDPLDTIGGVGGCAIMPALQLATMCPTHSVLLDTVSPCLGVVSYEMPIISRLYSPYSSARLFIDGIPRRQSEHHDAQKSTMTYEPRARTWLSDTVSPSTMEGMEKSGAILPGGRSVVAYLASSSCPLASDTGTSIRSHMNDNV